jgi:uncharacterized Zn finger protein
MVKAGRAMTPVLISGKRIATSFWGKAWCDNLERYADFESRLPRGRSYVRNGSVVHLAIIAGKITALVMGSEIYEIDIDIALIAPARWQAICSDCTGTVGSLIELLQGKFPTKVMERVCRAGDGLFPTPKEIKMSCTCPDWAVMCKHVAAVLYGVGARLDTDPDALFTLRGVDRHQLITTDMGPSMTDIAASSERVLAADDVAALFGIDMKADTAKLPLSNGSANAARPAPQKISRKAKATAPVPPKPRAAKTASASKPSQKAAMGRKDGKGRTMLGQGDAAHSEMPPAKAPDAIIRKAAQTRATLIAALKAEPDQAKGVAVLPKKRKAATAKAIPEAKQAKAAQAVKTRPSVLAPKDGAGAREQSARPKTEQKKAGASPKRSASRAGK